MHPDNIPFLTVAISAGVGSLVIGTIIGWCARSLFVSREIMRVSRDAWKQARILTQHKGRL